MKYEQLRLFEMPFDIKTKCYHYGDMVNDFYLYSLNDGKRFELHALTLNMDQVIQIFNDEEEMFNFIIEKYY